MLSSASQSCSSFGSRLQHLGINQINSHVKDVRYAVRGPVEDRANQIQAELQGGAKYPYSKLIPCNIGNPFAVGKHIMTFPRQVLAAAEYPSISRELPAEAAERALSLINKNPSTMGAYSHLQGLPLVRKEVASFISRRDGFESDPEKIYISQGATSAIVEVLHTLVDGPQDGIIIPIPQYPLYTALASLFGAQVVPYYLNESKGWAFDSESLLNSIKAAKDKGTHLKAMVVINPGNPTGTVLSENEMKQIVEICEEEGIVLVADEVYQENVYCGTKWQSFKRVAGRMKSRVQLASLNSISKGFFGECGHRSGYLEIQNIDEEVRQQIHKMFSLSICPNTAGQLMLSVAVNPPKSSECRSLWKEESEREIKSLEKRSNKLACAMNKLPGIHCCPASGAMYLFPKLYLPKKSVEASKKYMFNGCPVEPDLFWAMELMNQEGIMVTPGSGFGQVDGTYHFRITFLPEDRTMDEVIERISRFQQKFMEQFA